MKKTRYIIFLCLIMNGLIFGSASAQIQIDSVTTGSSTCPNNGNIEVYARSTNPNLFYSITAGPALHPDQTSSTFNSLPAGNYTVKVSDGAGNQATHTATVTGSYTPIDLDPVTTSPYCRGSNDGKIRGNLISGTGNGPYSWELIAPSPVTRPSQADDTFENLPVGSYTIKVTDDCGSYRTMVAEIDEPETEMSFGRFRQVLTTKTGCDSMYIEYWLEFQDARLPLSYKYETSKGTYTFSQATYVDSTYLHSPSPSISIGQLIPDLDYGDNVDITIYNACGDSLKTSHTISTFEFYPDYNFTGCGNMVEIAFNNSYSYIQDGLRLPVSYRFTDVQSGVVADSGTISVTPGNPDPWVTGVDVGPVEEGKAYRLEIEDGCGETFQQEYTTPTRNAPMIISKGPAPYRACLDSVAIFSVSTAGFANNRSLIITSGPDTLGSSKKDFQYAGTYTYPDTISMSGPYPTIYLQNLAAGTYHFKVVDDCGSEISDSLEVSASDLTTHYREVSLKKSCPGQSQINYSVSGRSEVTTKNILTNTIIKNSWYEDPSNKDSVTNLQPGVYEVIFEYRLDRGGYHVNDDYLGCWVVRDTITIDPYQPPAVTTSNSILCNTAVIAELVPDSTKGVPPYQYEIISGPQTFPIQDESIFSLNTAGTYTARIYDQCGNASTKQIFVDTNSIDPIIKGGATCNSIRIAYPSSKYFDYEWKKPDGSNFTGDSLILDPVSPADTGTYQISQVIDINGCVDTLFSSHHVSLNSSIYMQDTTICAGDSVKFGLNTYYSTGIYTDTLQSSAGCDSIIQLDLTVSAYKNNTIQETICPGGSLAIAGKIYNSPGTYYDTLATATCDSILTLEISAAPDPQVNLGTDTSLCQGQSLVLDAGSGHAVYFWNDNMVDSVSRTYTAGSAGKYWVRVESQQGCSAEDTVEILNMYPLPTADAGDDVNICPGDSVHLSASGGDYYQWSPIGTGQADIIVSPDITTTYSVIATDGRNCSSVADEVTVHVNPVSSKPVFTTGQVGHCFNEGPLSVEPEWGESFFWPATGDTTKEILVTDEGTYTVKVTDGSGCPVTGELVVENKCTSGIYVPDAFSPNFDGLHDELEIFGVGFRDFEMKIFNRWGEIIFISSDRNRRWDGRYLGKMMPVGNYPWIIHYRSSESEKMLTKRGSVTLVR